MAPASAEPPYEAVLAALVRSWRRRALLTQEQLADRTGLGVRTIRRLESADGLRSPRPESLRRLADGLDLTRPERAQLTAAATLQPSPPPEPPPASDPPPPPEPYPPPPLPPVGAARQLPADVAGFTGREPQLRWLDRLLTGDGGTPGTVPVGVVAGTAGVGKTALAIRWAHRVAGRFPDGQLYANLRGYDPSGTPAEPAAAIRGFLDALEVPPQRIPADLDAQAALYRSRLAGRRVLIVLDNARDAEQVRPLLPGTAGCVVVVTSRRELTGLVATAGAHPLTLDVPPPAEARDLLAHRLGRRPAAAEPAAVDEIVTLCARLPLALTIAAARAATRPDLPLPVLAVGLRDAGSRLDALTTGDAFADVRRVLSWSYRGLSPGAARLFRLFGLHPGAHVTAPAAASLAGLPAGDARPLIAELVEAHLATEPVPGRYVLHDLLRAYAVETVTAEETDDDRREATHRMLDHYLHTAYAVARLADPHRNSLQLDPRRSGVALGEVPDPVSASGWFDAECQVLLAVTAHAARTGFDSHVWQLAWAMATLLDRLGRWQDLATVQSAALASALRLGSPGGQVSALLNLSRAHQRMGRPGEAESCLRQVVETCCRLGDVTGQARAHYNLSAVFSEAGHHRAALAHARRALELFSESGSGQRRRGLDRLGACHISLGEYRQAITACQEALELNRESQDQPGEATALMHLGVAHQQLGQHRPAIVLYRSALRVMSELGDHYYQARVLGLLGDTLDTSGDRDRAREAWQRALHILDRLDHPDADQIRARLAADGRPHAGGVGARSGRTPSMPPTSG